MEENSGTHLSHVSRNTPEEIFEHAWNETSQIDGLLGAVRRLSRVESDHGEGFARARLVLQET